MPRFIDDTQACFADFIQKHPDLKSLELLADFCGVKLSAVQSWQRGDYFPGGRQLLGVRCFLQLAGYEVTELQQLKGDFKTLAWAIALGLVTPEATAAALGYVSQDPTQALWTVLLQGRGMSGDRAKKQLPELVTAYANQVSPKMQAWKRKITAVLAPPAVEVRYVEVEFDPVMLEAFARSVDTTAALAQVLIDKGAAQGARDATNGGASLLHLAELLQVLAR